MKLTAIRLSALRVDEVSGFFGRLVSMMGACPSIPQILGYLELVAALNNYNTARSRSRVVFSLSDKDTRADQAWQGLNMYLRACVYHYDESKRADAIKVKSVFDTIANPTTLNYDQEYGALTALLGKLDDLPPELLKAIDAQPWVENLRTRVADFYAASNEQAESKLTVKVGEVKELRTALNNAWYDVKQSLEYMSDRVKDSEIQKLVGKINLFIEGTKQKLAQRSSAKGGDETSNDDIQFDQVAADTNIDPTSSDEDSEENS